ncbi:MAG: PorV/PorQ family protein, partial [Chitinivibrionales bacterium]
MVRRIIVLLFVLAQQIYPIGQSSALTLAWPSGARSLGMGDVGTALADDEDALFYNPAGLALPNSRWNSGASSYYYEPVLPSFKIPDLWHDRWALIYQPEESVWGGFGTYFNRINFGISEWANDLGEVVGRANSYEYTMGLTWGFNFEEIGLKNHYFGISTKYVYSALAPGYGPGNEGVGQTFAFDVGYLWKFFPSMRFGLTVQNMGPNIFYISQQEQNPIPFTINMALAYSQNFITDNNIIISQVRAEIRTNREIVKNYIDKQPDPFWTAIYTDLLHDTSKTFKQQLDEFALHLGAEYTLFNTLSLRSGFLLDDFDRLYENHWGFGLKILNHFQFDYYWLYAPESYLGWLFHSQGNNGINHLNWG